MKNTNKKGFTIVELVIVIAVIAILAAVLIPTFASIIKKAQISADTQVCKNLNTALAAEEAVNNVPETFAEVIDILRDNGYIVANLNPTKEGNFYAWDEVTNQILYLDENFDIIYKAKELDDSSKTPNTKWHVAVSTEEDKAFAADKGVTVSLAPKSYEFMSQLNSMTTGSVVLTENININADSDANKLTINEGANVAINLAGSTIKVDEADQIFNGSRVFTVKGGTLNISGGTINAANSTDGSNGSYGAIRVEDGIANVSDMTLSNNRTNGMNIKVLEGATTTIGGNTAINSVFGGCVEAGGEVTITGGNYSQTGEYKDHCSTVVAVCSGGLLTIEGGTFVGENHGAYVFSTGGTIEIKDGDFKVTGTKELFVLTTGLTAATDSIIKISGGTFTVGNETKTFEQLDKTWLEANCDGETSVEKVGDAWVLTLAKAN